MIVRLSGGLKSRNKRDLRLDSASSAFMAGIGRAAVGRLQSRLAHDAAPPALWFSAFVRREILLI
jgi:hypothetical protein